MATASRRSSCAQRRDDRRQHVVGGVGAELVDDPLHDGEGIVPRPVHESVDEPPHAVAHRLEGERDGARRRDEQPCGPAAAEEAAEPADDGRVDGDDPARQHRPLERPVREADERRHVVAERRHDRTPDEQRHRRQQQHGTDHGVVGVRRTPARDEIRDDGEPRGEGAARQPRREWIGGARAHRPPRRHQGSEGGGRRHGDGPAGAALDQRRPRSRPPSTRPAPADAAAQAPARRPAPGRRRARGARAHQAAGHRDRPRRGIAEPAAVAGCGVAGELGRHRAQRGEAARDGSAAATAGAVGRGTEQPRHRRRTP